MRNEELAAEPAEQGQVEEMKAEVGATEEKTEKLSAQSEETEANAAKIKAKTEEIQAAIAEKVRKDSQELSALTPEDDLIDPDSDLRYDGINLDAVLAEMAADDERYTDINVITTATGLIFVYSDTSIAADDAAAKSLVEEAKFMMASAIRADSLDKIKLTPAGDIHAMVPDTDPKMIDAILKWMALEERYADIRSVTAVTGDVYYHSDKYLVDNHAATLLLAMAGDHCATIAEKVREESMIYPRATNADVFYNQQLFGIPLNDLEVILAETLRKPEYSDIKKMVQPATGAVYLYSDRYFDEESAWAMMDWAEGGLANNP